MFFFLSFLGMSDYRLPHSPVFCVAHDSGWFLRSSGKPIAGRYFAPISTLQLSNVQHSLKGLILFLHLHGTSDDLFGAHGSDQPAFPYRGRGYATRR